MKNKIAAVAFALMSFLFLSNNTFAQAMPMVGGMTMSPQKDIVDNAVNSKDHTTLVAAVKAAGLVETLKGSGPLTVFAPTNDAFENLPAGTVDNLLKPENKAMLTGILTYHVVAGRVSYNDLKEMIMKGHGKATLKTVSGGTLTAMMNGDVSITITDEKGNTANVSTYDVFQSNGVIHVIDRVLMPK
ncbi:MAG TPA: fasciclin domain-containing protein [Chitinophagales bacterium]|nr:fasciclin domain-containing protein [Chitinophagales bacterium]